MTLRTDLPNSSASLASGDKIGLLLVPPLVRSDRFVAERGVRLCFVPFPARVFVEGALGELEREPVRISILTKEGQSDSRDRANSPQRILKASAPRTPKSRESGALSCRTRATQLLYTRSTTGSCD